MSDDLCDHLITGTPENDAEKARAKLERVYRRRAKKPIIGAATAVGHKVGSRTHRDVPSRGLGRVTGYGRLAGLR